MIPSGRIRTNDRDVVDGAAEHFFAQFSADIGIIGCAGVTEIAELHSTQINLGSTKGDTHAFAMEHELREARVSQGDFSQLRTKVAGGEQQQVATKSQYQGGATQLF